MGISSGNDLAGITSAAADVTAVVRGMVVNVVYKLADLSSDGLAQGNRKAARGSGTTYTSYEKLKYT